MSLKESALKVTKSTAVRKGACALVLAILSALGYSQFGCAGGQLTPKAQARVAKFECQAAALAPLVAPTFDAVELLKDLYAGRANLGALLQRLDASEDEVEDLLKRLGQCDNSSAPEPVQPI